MSKHLPFTDPEKARAAGLRSAEAARERRENPEAHMRALFEKQRAALSNTLLDAAFGRGTFGGQATAECPSCGTEVSVDIPSLLPDKRLTAVAKALEYSIGRPAQAKAAPAPEPEKPRAGLVIE